MLLPNNNITTRKKCEPRNTTEIIESFHILNTPAVCVCVFVYEVVLLHDGWKAKKNTHTLANI